MTTAAAREGIYYDPYDIEVDTNPHPIWKRMRDEQPLYYNERHDFFALSRYSDVESALTDFETYLSGRGTTLDFIQSGGQPPAGNILWEDPPIHDLHRSLLARVFTPRKMAALEDQIREFCVGCLDPHVGSQGFDFITDLGALMPMRTVGMLLGIPESEQEAVRDRLDASMAASVGGAVAERPDPLLVAFEMFNDYIIWRASNPSDDLVTEMLNVEFEENGTRRKLEHGEILMYLMLLAGAGDETTTRLIGWTGKLLAEHPEQRADLVADPAMIPRAIEEILRVEAPSPVQCRVLARDVEHYGTTIEAGRVMLLLNGSANRDGRQFPDADSFDIHREPMRHLTFGRGIHFCMGASLARIEGRVALEEVLRRFPEWEVDWANASMAHTSSTRGWHHLPVRVG